MAGRESQSCEHGYLLELIVSFIGFILLLPVFVFLYFAIALGSRKNPLVGFRYIAKDRKVIRLVFFRVLDEENASAYETLTPADPRLSKFLGSIVAWRLERLPNLFAVFAGKARLVGPRPFPETFEDRIAKEFEAFLTVMPGLIDYSSPIETQVSGLLRREVPSDVFFIEEFLPKKLRLNQRFLTQPLSFSERMRLLFASCYALIEGHITSVGRVGHVVFDAIAVAVAWVLSYAIRFEFSIPTPSFKQMLYLLPYVVVLQVTANLLAGIYRILWRYFSLYEVKRFLKGVGVVFFLLLLFRLFPIETRVDRFRPPLSIIIASSVFSLGGMLFGRFFRRWLYETMFVPPSSVAEGEKAIIIGAGENGRLVAREIRVRPNLGLSVVGLVDDDPMKAGLEIEGFKVVGTLLDIEALHKRFRFSRALLAITELAPEKRRMLIDQCARLDIRLLVLPGPSELIAGKTRVALVREIRIEDLLGRHVRELTRDDPLLEPVFRRKRILVTGAGGSIGSEICRQVCRLEPDCLILVEKDETNLFVIQNEITRIFPDVEVVGKLIDIKEKEKVQALFMSLHPQVVLHTAAYKHVPLMEENPREAVENNVVGTKNVIEASVEAGAQRFVMLSTDKAVNPTSIMGATKRIAELLVRMFAEKTNSTRLASVRFGNVLGSRGSVIPLFRGQIERGGPVTVTHPEVTRYFMTIPEASQLVLKAATLANKGEIFVLDMGRPVKILDLAKDMIRLSGYSLEEIGIKIVGLRKGEKLFEELLVDKDKVLETGIPKVFVAKPELRDFELFMAQLEGLFAVSMYGDRAQVRDFLAKMDIGLREPDA
jgi:FlaA1/EpsC-like NDP-sugar epimerase/lipopolysaccharide/colanic/teichoic acid biosynthesis glycosyltransferase